MSEQKQGPISREEFQRWLEFGAGPLQAKGPGRSFTTLVKIPKQENVDYIFGQENYYASGVGWSDRFEFCGMYSRQSHTLRLAESPLTGVVDGLTPEERMDSEDIVEQFNARVNARVEELIADDRRNLPVETITSDDVQKDLLEYRQWGVREGAIRRFMDDTGAEIRFRSRFHADGLSEDDMVRYLLDPEGCVQAKADRYIQEHCEELLAQFLENDALTAEVRNLEADTDSPLHRMRSITQALERCGAKSVSVTVQKDGTELTFKTTAESLMGYKGSYSTWAIPAADRRQFYETFGRSAQYAAEDVTRITYGRSMIYEAPANQTEKLAAGPTMGGMGL